VLSIKSRRGSAQSENQVCSHFGLAGMVSMLGNLHCIKLCIVSFTDFTVARVETPKLLWQHSPHVACIRLKVHDISRSDRKIGISPLQQLSQHRICHPHHTAYITLDLEFSNGACAVATEETGDQVPNSCLAFLFLVGEPSLLEHDSRCFCSWSWSLSLSLWLSFDAWLHRW